MNATASPRVSVVLPVYNGATYLDEAIRSVVTQDFTDFELLLIDDGSTDASPELMAAWAARDPRIRLLRNDRNRGIAYTLNVGLEAARGIYVARQDADDISMPRRFVRQVAELDARPEVALVSTNYIVVDRLGRVRGRTRIANPPDVVRWRMLFSNAIGGHSQVMFRTELVRRIGGYDLDTRWSEDFDLWTRILEHGEILVLPILGMKHRMHDSRSSVLWRGEQRAMSYGITRRNLARHLGRSISDDEVEAVSHLWRLELQSGCSDRADRVVREVYRAVAPRSSRATRRRLRILTARQFTVVAAFLLRKGSVGDAALHLGRALRWHPLGLFKASWYIGSLAAYRLRRLVARR
jgi:glycosyltransferase involved in cell wall biosynthesis